VSGTGAGPNSPLSETFFCALFFNMSSTLLAEEQESPKFPEGSDVNDPNLVKVVMDLKGRAVYFSRSVIPHHRDKTEAPRAAYHLHLGIYAYRRDFLLHFSSWKPTPLELTEKLEQLRALEHGSSIFVMPVERATHGIDTEEQYRAFVKRYKGSA